jgi:hypothetical protein
MTDETTNPVGEEIVHDQIPEGVEQDHEFDAETNPEGTEGQRAQTEPDEEFEEVERGDKKYRVPKALKGELLMHGDYTRKTQELAEQRRSFEAERSQDAESRKALIKDHARVEVLSDQIGQYEQVDWQSWQARIRQAQAEGRFDDAQSDMLNLQQTWSAYEQAKNAHGKAVEELQTKERERTSKLQRETEQARATQLEQSIQALRSDIKGFDPEYNNKLRTFAGQHGVTADEYAGLLYDPRNIKFLNMAFLGQQALEREAKAARQQQRAQTLEAQQQVKPAAQVGGNAPATRVLDDRLGGDEWMKRRNEQIAKRRRR